MRSAFQRPHTYSWYLIKHQEQLHLFFVQRIEMYPESLGA